MLLAVTDAELLTTAGFDASVAIVLQRVEEASHMVALIDTNGDGRQVELQTFWPDEAGRWRCGVSVGAGYEGAGDLDAGHGYRYRRNPDGSWLLELVQHDQ